MESLRSVQSNRKLQVVRLSIPVGLAMVFVVILLWVCMGGAPAIASPPAVAEAAVLSNGDVITIGVAAALSGPADFIGWTQANAVQLAISQTNAAGGVDIGGVDYTLIMVTADSACDSTQAITAANTLLNAGAMAIVGHTCSSASFAAQSIYNAVGVPMISPSSSRIDLTEQGYTTTFRVYQREDAEAILVATHFRKWLGMDAVTLVERSGTGLEWATNAFSNTFTSLGGTITSRRTITSTDDYTATLTAIQVENPDAIFYIDNNADDAGFFSSIAHNQGFGVIGWDAILGGDVALANYATVAGSAAEGDYAGLNGRRTQDMPGYDTLNADYQAAGFPNYGDEADVWGAYAYDAAKIIIAAIDRVDNADPAAIRGEIAATANHAGVVGTYEGFDGRGDVIPQWSQLMLYQNGQWVMVSPDRVFLPLVLNSVQ
jgi:branched-chain amino acid transport system substrate-binding protein